MDKNQKILFLDDNPKRIASFKVRVPHAHIAVTAARAIQVLREESTEWDMLFLDQNLWRNGGRDTGMEVVDWVVKNRPNIKQIFIHSHDLPASIKMEKKLKAAGYNVVAEPYWLFDPRATMTGEYEPWFDRKKDSLYNTLNYRWLD